MPESGRNSILSIDGTDITSFCDSQSLNRVRDSIETTPFGVDDKEYITGLGDATIPISGKWSAALDTVMHGADDGASVLFEMGPEGSTASNVKYSGSCNITDYSFSTTPSGAVEWSATFQKTGALTRGAY